jgi:probable F420-dependent oxidoreductase
MRIDLATALCSPFATPEYVRVLATEAEHRGFHGLWIGDHVLRFDTYTSPYPYTDDGHRRPWPGDGLLEPFTALTYVAACTTRLRLGTGVLILPQRNPVYTASQAAAVDWLSHGRLDLGIGVGWSEQEFDAVGVPFAQRGRRADEYVAVLRTLWCDDPSSHTGPFYELAPCRLHPKPVQRPHPPIHVGGNTDAALRRVARLGQGWYGLGLAPDACAERVRRLEELLAAQGRTRADVEVIVSTYGAPVGEADVAAYARAGVDRLLLGMRAGDVGEIVPALDALAPTVAAAAQLS